MKYVKEIKEKSKETKDVHWVSLFIYWGGIISFSRRIKQNQTKIKHSQHI